MMIGVTMAAPLDLDQLQTFISISDTGSFTRAAGEVHRTQSAVSMQMRRLEERVGKPTRPTPRPPPRPHSGARGRSGVVGREPLLWVSSANHATHEQEVLP